MVGVELIFQRHNFLPFYTVHAVLSVRILEWFATASPSDHILTALSRMTCLSWVALHEIAHTVTKLCIAICHTRLEKGMANGKPLQYSCLGNLMNSMEKAKRCDNDHWTSRASRCPICCWRQWRNISRKKEQAEPKRRQRSVVGVSGDGRLMFWGIILHRNMEC